MPVSKIFLILPQLILTKFSFNSAILSTSNFYGRAQYYCLPSCVTYPCYASVYSPFTLNIGSKTRLDFNRQTHKILSLKLNNCKKRKTFPFRLGKIPSHPFGCEWHLGSGNSFVLNLQPSALARLLAGLLAFWPFPERKNEMTALLSVRMMEAWAKAEGLMLIREP